MRLARNRVGREQIKVEQQPRFQSGLRGDGMCAQQCGGQHAGAIVRAGSKCCGTQARIRWKSVHARMANAAVGFDVDR